MGKVGEGMVEVGMVVVDEVGMVVRGEGEVVDEEGVAAGSRAKLEDAIEDELVSVSTHQPLHSHSRRSNESLKSPSCSCFMNLRTGR